jgi:hypothetical protein
MTFPERRDSIVGNGFHRTENSHSAVLADANLIKQLLKKQKQKKI